VQHSISVSVDSNVQRAGESRLLLSGHRRIGFFSKHVYASQLRTSIDKIIIAKCGGAELEKLRQCARSHSESWLEREKELDNLTEAEETLKSGAERVGNMRNELNVQHAQSVVLLMDGSDVVGRKRVYDEVEEQVQKGSNMCKTAKLGSSRRVSRLSLALSTAEEPLAALSSDQN
jgi:hypothetical protein